MSLINKMLQDLDKRNAGAAGPEAGAIAAHVRPVSSAHVGSDWFWRVLAGVLLFAVCWIVWLMWEISPRSLVTEKVNLSAKAPEVAPPSTPVALTPATAQSSTGPTPVAATADAVPVKPAVGLEMLRMATEITTPIPAAPRQPRAIDKETVGTLDHVIKPAARKPPPPRHAINPEKAAPVITAPVPAAKKVPPSPMPSLAMLKPELSAPLPRQANGARIDRRDTTSVRDKAEAEFRRAVGLINQGRMSEGMEALRSSLQIDPTHQAARQNMVALQIESKRYDEAMQTLGEGIAVSPKNIQFVMLLARLMVERNDVAGAFALLDAHAADAGGNADFRAFRAALQQRMGRHREAIEDYRAALAIAPGAGQWWLGLGISQQADAQIKDALESFRRARTAGNLTPELMSYAEQRIRQLQ